MNGTLVPKAQFDKRKREQNRARFKHDDEAVLTAEEFEKYQILRYCSKTFTDAKKARKQHEVYDDAWKLYIGEMWSQRRPDWRASITINKIRAFITFMQAIMTDNKPRLSVEPLVPGSEDAADLLRKLVDRDWDDNDMQQVISQWVLFGLIWGYSFIKVTYDPFADNGRGKHAAVAIPPYKIYANRTATCVEDAEYLIHVEDVTMGWVRRNFPQKAEIVDKFRGLKTDHDVDKVRNRDYIQDGNAGGPRIVTAMNIDGNIVMPQSPMTHPNYLDERDRDTVEIEEYWLRDDTLEAYQRQVVENGQGKFEPMVEGGVEVLEIVGYQPSTEPGYEGVPIPVRQPKMKPVMETAWRKKYPNGRLVVIAAGRVLLRDIPNPYQIDGFPFAMWKDYDVGGFHGQGEPLALRSCAFAVNKLASQLFEILVKTGNPSWKAKKDAGINLIKVTNRPGLVIPMDDVTALVPLEKPPIPPEFLALYKLVSEGMAEVSGINDAVKGAMPAANTAATSIDQLLESGSAPIRLKVRNMESGLRRYGKLRIQLIQQYDQGQRPLRLSAEEYDSDKVQSPGEVAVQFREYRNVDIQGQVEFSIVPISSLSTSPAGTWNKWMDLYSKHLVDRTWWMKQFRLPGWKSELPRMQKQEAEDAQKQADAKDKSKPGPTPKKPARDAHRRRLPSPSNLPTQADNAAVR